MLQATDPVLFHPQPGLEDTGAEVLFVGNSRRVLRPVVRDALEAGLPLTVYGDLWDGLVPDGVVAGRSLPNDELYLDLISHSTNGGAVDHAALLAVRPQSISTNPDGGFALYRIGDAVTGRNIHAAVYDALRLCSAI